MGFGPHLMVDCFHFDKVEELSDLNNISEFLWELSQDIEMTPITQPYVFPYKNEDAPEDEGVTGNLIIAESHISIHTFPKKDYAFVDVFSCREFNTADALEFISDYLSCDYEKHLVHRGKGFTRS